ncbi:hypothetical protein Lser_V15G08023 [Lactuca serriola]
MDNRNHHYWNANLDSNDNVDVDVNVNDNVEVEVDIDVDVDVNVNASDNVDVNDNHNVVVDDNVDFHTFDIFDPRNWDALESNMINILVLKEKLLSLDDITLKSCCMSLETSLKKDEQSNIDGNDLYVELKLLLHLLPKEKLTTIDILNFLKRVDCFPITSIAYRIMLTIPVTVAYAERSFSQLKILKSYLRSTMTQERLNGLVLMTIKRNMLD